MPSEDVLLSINPGHPAMHAGLSEAAVAPARTLRGIGGATEIVTEILGPEA